MLIVPFNPAVFDMILYVALLFNLIAIIYLFSIDMSSQLLHKIGKSFPIFFILFVFLPVGSFFPVLELQNWWQVILVALGVNFGMDTGAWFFGVRFGKHKLWKEVSPKKSIEGLIGGIITATIIGSLLWYFLFGEFFLHLIPIFAFLALISQVGDLIQSKIKRQFNIKDSSHLIPGHGGLYDRVDSLLFMIPFYTITLRILI